MPNTYFVADILLGDDAEDIAKILVKVRKEDLTLINNVYPEAGVQTYLTGHFYRKLADHLREKGITDVTERVVNSEFKNLQDLIDHVQIRKPSSSRRRPNSKSSGK